MYQYLGIVSVQPSASLIPLVHHITISIRCQIACPDTTPKEVVLDICEYVHTMISRMSKYAVLDPFWTPLIHGIEDVIYVYTYGCSTMQYTPYVPGRLIGTYTVSGTSKRGQIPYLDPGYVMRCSLSRARARMVQAAGFRGRVEIMKRSKLRFDLEIRPFWCFPILNKRCRFRNDQNLSETLNLAVIQRSKTWYLDLFW